MLVRFDPNQAKEQDFNNIAQMKISPESLWMRVRSLEKDTVTYDEEEENYCSMCLDLYEQGDHVCLLACRHILHIYIYTYIFFFVPLCMLA